MKNAERIRGLIAQVRKLDDEVMRLRAHAMDRHVRFLRDLCTDLETGDVQLTDFSPTMLTRLRALLKLPLD